MACVEKFRCATAASRLSRHLAQRPYATSISVGQRFRLGISGKQPGSDGALGSGETPIKPADFQRVMRAR